MVVHAHHIQFDQTPQKCDLLYGAGKLCSKFGEDLCINDIAILTVQILMEWNLLLLTLLLHEMAYCVLMCRSESSHSLTSVFMLIVEVIQYDI